jgi:DNA-binding LytR/AlgR family response regulator
VTTPSVLSPWGLPSCSTADRACSAAASAATILLNAAVMRYAIDWRDLGELAWRVLVVSLLVMAVRALVWRRPAVVVETRTVVAPPLPEAEARFRQRLPARVRAAQLIAAEAHDHYLKVHTDVGCEMIIARFAGALRELTDAYGLRTHLSWGVAGDSIKAVRWSRGTGTATLAGGIVVPSAARRPRHYAKRGGSG